ncbi:MAG: DNA methyltransferase [Phycisphaerae bacterium]
MNQKPLRLLELCIRVSSDAGDVVWEPFGGLCTTAVASKRLMRKCFVADINPDYFKIAVERLEHANALFESPAGTAARRTISKMETLLPV